MRLFLDKSRVWHTVAMLCPELRLRARTRLRRACGVALLLTAVSSAQNTVAAPAPEQASEPIATLHVYTNLAQMPVLVLTPLREEMKPVTEARFRLSIDGGQPFKPTHVRREADDPLSLAILIDTTKPRFDLLPKVEDAIVSLRPACSLRTTSPSASWRAVWWKLTKFPPTPPPCARQPPPSCSRTETASRTPTPDRCRPALPLWDAMAHLTAQLWQRKGRRVLIVLSDGRDTGSKTTWQKVQEVTQATSTTVFGIVTAPVTLTGRNFNTEDQDLFRRAHLRNANGFEDPFKLPSPNSAAGSPSPPIAKTSTSACSTSFKWCANATSSSSPGRPRRRRQPQRRSHHNQRRCLHPLRRHHRFRSPTPPSARIR